MKIVLHRDRALLRHFLAASVVFAGCRQAFLASLYGEAAVASYKTAVGSHLVPVADSTFLGASLIPSQGLSMAMPFVAMGLACLALLMAGRKGPLSGVALSALSAGAGVLLDLASRPFEQGLSMSGGLFSAIGGEGLVTIVEPAVGAFAWLAVLAASATLAAVSVGDMVYRRG